MINIVSNFIFFKYWLTTILSLNRVTGTELSKILKSKF